MMTQTAQKAGLKAGRWTNDDFDLETEEGYQSAEKETTLSATQKTLAFSRMWTLLPNAKHQSTDSGADRSRYRKADERHEPMA